MSKIEVNTADVQCGSTLTLGSSGKTVTLASGASQSGFGRTGTVDWCTKQLKHLRLTVSGKGYFYKYNISGAVTVTLPASPSGKDIIAIKDYAGTLFKLSAVTVACRNESLIGGSCCATLSTLGQSVTFVLRRWYKRLEKHT